MGSTPGGGTALVLWRQQRDQVLGISPTKRANFKIDFDFRGKTTTIYAISTAFVFFT
jgi:hypothetical protein